MFRRIAEVVLAVLVGAALVAVLVRFVFPPDDAPSPTTTEVSTTTTTHQRTSEPATFLDDYERSLTGTYLVRGTETKYKQDTELVVIHFKLTRRGSQTFEQYDETILLADGTVQKLCHQEAPNPEITCGPDQAAPTVEERVVLFRERLTPQGDANQADYEVYRTANGCWDIVATRAMPFSDWGQTGHWCFDQETGAITYQESVIGDDRVLRETQSITSDVVDDDFAPDLR